MFVLTMIFTNETLIYKENNSFTISLPPFTLDFSYFNNEVKNDEHIHVNRYKKINSFNVKTIKTSGQETEDKTFVTLG